MIHVLNHFIVTRNLDTLNYHSGSRLRVVLFPRGHLYCPETFGYYNCVCVCVVLLASTGQRQSCSTSYHVQDSPHNKKIMWPKMSLLLRLSNPELEQWSFKEQSASKQNTGV